MALAEWIQTGILAVAVPIGLVQLWRSRRANELLAYLRWEEAWGDSKWVRYQAREVVPFKPEHPASLEEEDYRSMNNAISALSSLEQLLQEGLLSPRLVLSSAHSEILRTCYATKEYRSYRESQIGSRYGRRLDELEARARRYHYVRKRHRGTAIVWKRPDGDVELVPPLKSAGIGATQRLIYSLRDLLRRY